MLPLGYWIKEVDRRIEDTFGRLLADEGVTRRHWQVLTTLARGDASRSELDTALAPFAPTVRPQVDDLIRRGWVTEVAGGPGVRLTTAGRAAHDRVAERVRVFRARVAEGLSEREYATLVALLERVAGNLTPA
ncbi:MarR family winged helix-turn-helix transcriptional regulator [Actinoplanes auranticolor]|uniref:HTH marR-type domain-containing protein n=1 Tax=Actinoplanes auranticolor TaxID=47988 RepID=A0A919VS20_9ACTN|nr:hypothetical protein [Actinoplanes auranticolor]GIM73752.1 hypothetical protein Aau02nite_57480 [Actinoplanes auranticolor]